MDSLASTPVISDINQAMINITPDDGLSQVTINSLVQDDLGFIWLGTQAGLNRYDGFEFKKYKAKPLSKNHLAGNYITSLCLSGKNQLWIGTSTGLSVYNLTTGLFTSFIQYFNPVIPSDNIASLYCTEDVIYVGTQNNGLYQVDVREHQVSTFDSTIGFQINEIQLLATDVVFASKKGVFRLDQQTKNSELIIEGFTSSLLIKENKLYVGRPNGWLHAYIFERGNFKATWQLLTTEMKNSRVNTLVIEGERIWVATQNGVFVVDFNGKMLETFQSHLQSPNSLQDNIVLSLLVDKNQNIWLGTESRGINFLSKQIKKFGHINQFSYSTAPIENHDMRGFALDNKQRLWFATSRGAFIFSGDGFRRVENVYPMLKAFSKSFITAIKFQNDNVWILTRGDGAAYLNLTSKKITYFNPKRNNSPTFGFVTIIQYQNDWIFGTRDKGLLQFNKALNKLEPYLSQFSNIPTHVLGLLVKDDALWFGSLGKGLFRYQNTRLENLSTQQGLLSNISAMLVLDNMDRVWVASEVGINIIDQNFKIIKKINKQNGLNNDAIWALVYDQIDSMWVGTSGGLSRVNTADFNIENYGISHGAQGSEYNFGAAWLSPEGRVFIGGATGFNQFDPKQVNQIYQKPKIVLTGITVLGKKVLVADDDSLIDILPEKLDTIQLDYKQDIMSFKYSSLSFRDQSQIKFYYRVRGLSDVWLPMEKGSRRVNLIKLPPGIYQLETYAQNIQGQRSDIHLLNINLRHPWWWSPISKVCYSFLLIFILWFTFNWRYKNYKRVIKANKTMMELKQRLELSLWASGDELWDWDVVNSSMRRHAVSPRLDYSDEQQKVGINDLGAFIHQDDRAQFIAAITACINSDLNRYEVIFRVKDFFGNWCWVQERGKVVSRDESGTATRISGSIKDIEQIKQHEQVLQDLNEQLEQKVRIRTAEIYNKNKKLEITIEQLKDTQNELIESEKMASLGGLVAGIAHEINTPLGIAITAITFNQDLLSTIKKQLENKTLKQSDLVMSIGSQNDGYKLILKNLDRANNLIANFKQVAVDQSSETKREINITEYIHEVIQSVKPLIKSKNIDVKVEGPTALILNTYPGPIYQMVSNFINNSVLHGFENRDEGEIIIAIGVLEEKVYLNYSDNGKGIAPDIIDQVFEPFVTSKRNQGGSGLGMHIVYNLVTQVLKGEIKCESHFGQGVEFKVNFPLDVK